MQKYIRPWHLTTTPRCCSKVKHFGIFSGQNDLNRMIIDHQMAQGQLHYQPYQRSMLKCVNQKVK